MDRIVGKSRKILSQDRLIGNPQIVTTRLVITAVPVGDFVPPRFARHEVWSGNDVTRTAEFLNLHGCDLIIHNGAHQ